MMFCLKFLGYKLAIDNYISNHSVLKVILTFNISNIKKEGGFDSKIFVGIMWYTQFFPLSAPLKSLVWYLSIWPKFT